MTEPTVQVPVSLANRLLEGRETVADLRELRALLPQPTPTAESALCEFGTCSGGDTPQHHTVECATGQAPTEPPRIEAMAPGTTFRINEDEDDEIWTVRENRIAVCSTHGVGRYLDVFDPSTIRDVTPPTEVH